jgi:xanthine dehydrogenase YagT iron-sulfur-binding subunit
VIEISLFINGQMRKCVVDPRTTLLHVLRERFRLTGAKKGCDHGQCGSCTILVEGRRIASCLALAAAQDGYSVQTIEGLASEDELHPVQRAFVEHDALQCGYCTPGQICSVVGMLDEVAAGWPSSVTEDLAVEGVSLNAAEVRERMSGNLCRCAAYVNIVDAVMSLQ